MVGASKASTVMLYNYFVYDLDLVNFRDSVSFFSGFPVSNIVATQQMLVERPPPSVGAPETQTDHLLVPINNDTWKTEQILPATPAT